MGRKSTGVNWASNLGLLGAVGAAVAASACCVLPLGLAVLGLGGAWAGSLSILAPWRPLFIVVTAGLLAFGFYRVYRRRPEEACEPGSACADPGTDRRNRIMLWAATLVAAVLLALPY
ncbi:MAG TPA: mercury transporter MerT, partial [Bacteroidetes bacterium]|nr:mercury transporter MerT [Bacteroidota bacterium]